MSESLHELCCCLVEEFYGEFHARLFSRLVYHGRLSASQLAQKCHLPLKQVKAGLSALVQSRLIYHHTALDSPSTYQANTNTSYDIIRTGKLIDLACAQFGTVAATVIAEAASLGFATNAELEDRASEVLIGQQEKLFDGEQDEGRSALIKDVRASLQDLLSSGYLVRLRSAHLQSEFDAKQDIETYLKLTGNISSQKGKKAVMEQDEKVETEFNRRINTRTMELGYVPVTPSDKKRPSNELDDQPASKRQRLGDNRAVMVNGYSISNPEGGDGDNAMLVCVSFRNVVSSIRNSRLVDIARKSLGTVYAKVLASALTQVPSSERWELQEEENWLDLSQLRDEASRPQVDSVPNGRQVNGNARVNGTNAHYDDDLGQELISFNELDRALAQLASSEFQFIHSTAGSYAKEWRFSKGQLDQYVRGREVLRMMGNRLGPPSLRLIRMMMQNGKLDEKTLQEAGLLSAKDLRQTLADLKQMGYIDLQEVPREAQRQPNRTIYLWFHDANRVQKVLLDGLYKAMTRLLQRLKTEKMKLSSTLEKVERSDVKGNEEQIMSAAELRLLRRWQRLEEWLLGEVSRLDESVALLRDL